MPARSSPLTWALALCAATSSTPSRPSPSGSPTRQSSSVPSSFWGQAAGGLIWTNHKYPAFGGPPYNSQNDGPNADASVFNFTPQGGVGVHYFVRPRRSIDFSANGVHISSASLGDRNPGVNASVQFSLGYTWWK